MKTRPQESGARRVQPSGRPSGAPYGLDAPAGLWERLGSGGTGGFERLFQTPEHNLIRPEIGPTVGDHFSGGLQAAGEGDRDHFAGAAER